MVTVGLSPRAKSVVLHRIIGAMASFGSTYKAQERAHNKERLDMEIVLKNYEITPIINFLQGLELMPTDSRHRSKFVKALVPIAESLQESEKELLEQYGKRDELGELIRNENGTYDITSSKSAEYAKEVKTLLREEILVVSGAHSANFEEIPRILRDCNKTLSGNDADVFDRLMDEFGV